MQNYSPFEGGAALAAVDAPDLQSSIRDFVPLCEYISNYRLYSTLSNMLAGR